MFSHHLVVPKVRFTKYCHLCRPRMNKLVPTCTRKSKSEVKQIGVKDFGLAEEEQNVIPAQSY